MSMVLVLKCAALGFALAIAATVGVLAGPVSAGLALVTFLLGVAANELFHMRLSPVDAGAHAAADSAFLALLAAGDGARAEVPSSPLAVALLPPKRNFRLTSDAIATGSGLHRTELTARRRRHIPPPRPGPELRSEPRSEAAAPAPRHDLRREPQSESRPEIAAPAEPLSFRAAYAGRVA